MPPKLRNKNTSFKTWGFLGSGTYNTVFVYRASDCKLVQGSDYSGPWVRREPKEEHFKNTEVFPMLEHKRALRVFNEVNKGILPPAGSYDEGERWVAPFFEGRPANDKEAQAVVLSIYQETKRILLDAFASGNIRTNGHVTVCVDTDMAFRPSSPASKLFAIFKEDERNVSEKVKYVDGLLITFEEKFKEQEASFPTTIKTIKALLYLERQLEDVDIDSKTITEDIIDALSWCINNKKEIDKDIMGRLQALQLAETPLSSELLQNLFTDKERELTESFSYFSI